VDDGNGSQGGFGSAEVIKTKAAHGEIPKSGAI